MKLNLAVIHSQKGLYFNRTGFEMSWELDRIQWNRLRVSGGGNAGQVPQAIRELKTASTREEAERAYWRIDNKVIVQGALFEAAVAATSSLIEALMDCTSVSRPYILELLVQIGSGYPSPIEIRKGNTKIKDLCLQELCRGQALFFFLLENRNEEEIDFCIDILGLCSLHDESLKERVLWCLERLSSLYDSTGLTELITNWKSELELEKDEDTNSFQRVGRS